MTLHRLKVPLTNVLASLCLLIFVTGCETVVTETRTVKVPVERLVPVDPKLTQCNCQTREPEIWLDAAVIAIQYRQCYEACRARMHQIRKLGAGDGQ